MLKPPPADGCTIFFASPLEGRHIARIESAYPELRLLVPAALWPELRYEADHNGIARTFSPAEEATWLEMMAAADVFFDFDRRHLSDLPRLAPRLRWIQSTSAGVVHYVEESRVDAAGIVVTTASGVHAVPLAEWVSFAVLWHEKRAAHLARLRAARNWERFCGGEAKGKTALIAGYGAVGAKAGEYLEALGVRVYGLTSRGLAKRPGDYADELLKADTAGMADAGNILLDALLPLADYLVIALPGVPATAGLFSRERLNLLPPGAMVINVGRGSVVDEGALTDYLLNGRLAAAALDVFATEPLPTDSPLWRMDNVLINPHSASTSHQENGRITDIFIDNIGRYLRGETLRNVYNSERGY